MRRVDMHAFHQRDLLPLPRSREPRLDFRQVAPNATPLEHKLNELGCVSLGTACAVASDVSDTEHSTIALAVLLERVQVPRLGLLVPTQHDAVVDVEDRVVCLRRWNRGGVDSRVDAGGAIVSAD